MVQSRGKMSRAQGWSWKLPKLIKMELERNLCCVGWTYFVECEPLNQQFQFESSLVVFLQVIIPKFRKSTWTIWWTTSINPFRFKKMFARDAFPWFGSSTHPPPICAVDFASGAVSISFVLGKWKMWKTVRYVQHHIVSDTSMNSWWIAYPVILPIRWKTWKCTAIITQWEHCLSMGGRT